MKIKTFRVASERAFLVCVKMLRHGSNFAVRTQKFTARKANPAVGYWRTMSFSADSHYGAKRCDQPSPEEFYWDRWKIKDNHKWGAVAESVTTFPILPEGPTPVENLLSRAFRCYCWGFDCDYFSQFDALPEWCAVLPSLRKSKVPGREIIGCITCSLNSFYPDNDVDGYTGASLVNILQMLTSMDKAGVPYDRNLATERLRQLVEKWLEFKGKQRMDNAWWEKKWEEEVRAALQSLDRDKIAYTLPANVMDRLL
jgi:hypothetical protein